MKKVQKNISIKYEKTINLFEVKKGDRRTMGCLGYIIFGLFILWLLESFTIGRLILAGIVGYVVYKIFLD